MSRIVHVLWSPQTGPICAYEDPAIAWKHAIEILGVEVLAVELRAELPDFVQSLNAAGDDDVTTPIALEDIADVEAADLADDAADDW